MRCIKYTSVLEGEEKVNSLVVLPRDRYSLNT